MPPALHITVDRNIQKNSERNIIDEHRRASEAHERQRNTGDRKKSYCHAHILNKVEREVTCKSGHHVGCGFGLDLCSNVKASAEEEERQDDYRRRSDKAHVF